MDGDRFLQGPHPAEALHGAFASSKRLMRILRTIVGPTTGFAIVRLSQVLQRRAVGSQFVCDEDMRATVAFHRFAEKFQCGFAIPALCNKSLQDFSLMVDGPPEVVRDAVELHEDLV